MTPNVSRLKDNKMADNKSNNFGLIDPITNTIGLLYNIGSGIATQVQNAKNDKWNKEFAQKQFDYQKEINDRNQQNWQTAFDYQKDLNNQIMSREDNAVQRRAADLQAAGISKNLAAGSPAQAAALSSVSSGNTGSGFNSGAIANSNKQFQQMQKMDIMNSYAQYEVLKSDSDLKKVQAIVEAKREGLVDEQTATERINQLVGVAKARNLDKDTELKGSQKEGQDIKNKRDKRDADIDENRNTKSGEHENSVLTSARAFGTTMAKFLSGLFNKDSSKVEFNSGGKHSESDLINIIREYNELAYKKYGSILSTSSHDIYDKFFRAFYDSIPGDTSKEKQAWIFKYRN